MIVGECPSDSDINSRTPFTGGAGVMLDKMLLRAGILKRDCFFTNVTHVAAPKNDFLHFYKKDNIPQLMAGMIQLKQDVQLYKPNVIVALGSHVLKVLTGKVGIDKYRGSILPGILIPGSKIIGTYHPNYVMKIYDYKPIAEFDLKKVRQQSTLPTITYPTRTFYLPGGNVTRRIGIEWVNVQESYDVDSILADMCASAHLSVDIECHQNAVGKWELTCVGFADRPDRALVLAADSGSNMERIRRACEHGIPKVMQNGSFDYTVLRERGIICENFTHDTMLAHHTLFAEAASGGDEIAKLTGKKRQSAFAKGLAFQTSIYTNEPFYKDDGKLWKIDGDRLMFYRYNALDCCVTKEIQEVQQVELRNHPGGEFHFAYEMGLVQPVLKATRRGLRVDLKRREEMKADYELQISRLQAVLDIFAGGPINVKSSPEVQHLLYDKLKLPKQYSKRKKADGSYEKTVSADKDALNLLASKYNNPALLTILKIRERRDLIERYLNAKLDVDTRMRSSVDITGTRTSRLAYRASLSGSGTNLQNQPEELRQIYLADEGYLMVYSDYSQAEARVVAYLADCKGLIELFTDPTRDIHCENAARIFNKKIPRLVANGGDVTPEERYLAKRVVHASNYGMGPDRLVQIVNQDAETTGIRIDMKMAEFLLQSYFMIYPELKEVFWAGVRAQLNATKTLRNPFGWSRTFYGRMDNQKALNEAYAHVPQSAVGVLCGQAWIRADKALEPLGGEVLVNVHDALVSQVRINKLAESIAAIEESMKISMTIGDCTFFIPTDIQVGYNWGHRGKDGSNPRGLIDYAKWKLEHAV